LRLVPTIALLLVGGCSLSEGFLDPAGPVAAAQADHFLVVTLLMLLVILPLFVALPIILWRYRRGGNGDFQPDWNFNKLLEWLVWGVPFVVVLVLAVKLWTHTRDYDPYRSLGRDSLVVEVVSLDWKFLFLYPDQGVATVDLLALPEGRPITLKLTSGTVMQSFIVPQLAGQIYTMAGMVTRLNLKAYAAGDFIGRNTQYNGNGFATQSFKTLVMPEVDFAGWVEKALMGTETLDWAGYQTLLEPSKVGEPILYARFEDGLFDRVIASFAPDMVGNGTVGAGSKTEAVQ